MGHPTNPAARPPCAVPWCRRGHLDTGDRAHSLDLGTFASGAVAVAVVLLQFEAGGVLAAPVIRVFVDSTDRRQLQEQTDLAPQAATVLGQALADMALVEIGRFIAALGRGQIILGERDEPVDYYEGTFVATPSALQVEAATSTHHDDPNRGGDSDD